VCFGKRQENRVIARLRSPLDDHNGSVRVVGGLGDDLEE
jgi:hypothetical protein